MFILSENVPLLYPRKPGQSENVLSEFSVFRRFLLQKRCPGGLSENRPVNKTQAQRHQNQSGAKSANPRLLPRDPGVLAEQLPAANWGKTAGQQKTSTAPSKPNRRKARKFQAFASESGRVTATPLAPKSGASRVGFSAGA